MKQNLSVEAALEIVLQEARPLQSIEQLPLMAAYGGILGANLSSKVNHPSADDTAVDGYACLEADARSAAVGNPVKLRVIGQSPAGKPFTGKVGSGEAVQVFTGAPIPKGANAVIRVEDTLREGEFVWLMKPATAADIRRKGDDLVLGRTYLHKGDLLTPGRVGLAAAMGYATLPVVRRPRVGILATGDEVVEPGEPLPFGGVYNSNSYSVAGLVLEAGGEPVILPKVSDSVEGVRTQLQRAGKLDLLLTTGGVSMGEYDIVRRMLELEGEIHFWKVRMQPGGPFLFARWNGLPLMGLPGNPVSAMVSFLLFGRAFLFKLLGRTDPPHQPIEAVADTPFEANPTRRAYRRAVLRWTNDGYRVASTGNQSSAVLNSMAVGNALVVLEAGHSVREGQRVEVIPFPGGLGTVL
ncbi:MAG: molybdopterin molybdotransferase MoeA [Meiothermus sp.]|uniref:molybdopterin molybdotransferase MoeA n=1 Tax=Meiothermus sp. TaxID=1955249 RepID=UPI00298F191A|nr:gephyrin-like molybdotransferase Glp [Meiothermus sp.]MCX7601995.1 molybdopterin molybdotransferase MoeA [Meiothermus sp.]MDW8426739.1 molybdopterin molybdotransferase MoeA [Meiothermus sp.]